MSGILKIAGFMGTKSRRFELICEFQQMQVSVITGYGTEHLMSVCLQLRENK